MENMKNELVENEMFLLKDAPHALQAAQSWRAQDWAWSRGGWLYSDSDSFINRSCRKHE